MTVWSSTALAGVTDLRFLHFEPEVVAFTRALADAGEAGIAAVESGQAGDELLDDDRLADAGAAEQAGLATLRTSGQSRSMTLMPVSKISVFGSRGWSSSGGSR